MTLAHPKIKPPPAKAERKSWPEKVKQEVRERSGGVCEAHRIKARYGLPKSCDRKAEDLDHMKPVWAHGKSTTENAAHLCKDCHKVKTRIDNREAKEASRKQGYTGQAARRAKRKAAGKKALIQSRNNLGWKPDNYVSPLSKAGRKGNRDEC